MMPVSGLLTLICTGNRETDFCLFTSTSRKWGAHSSTKVGCLMLPTRFYSALMTIVIVIFLVPEVC